MSHVPLRTPLDTVVVPRRHWQSLDSCAHCPTCHLDFWSICCSALSLLPPGSCFCRLPRWSLLTLWLPPMGSTSRMANGRVGEGWECSFPLLPCFHVRVWQGLDPSLTTAPSVAVGVEGYSVWLKFSPSSGNTRQLPSFVLPGLGLVNASPCYSSIGASASFKVLLTLPVTLQNVPSLNTLQLDVWMAFCFLLRCWLMQNMSGHREDPKSSRKSWQQSGPAVKTRDTAPPKWRKSK